MGDELAYSFGRWWSGKLEDISKFPPGWILLLHDDSRPEFSYERGKNLAVS
jgi:hypothetical protein